MQTSNERVRCTFPHCKETFESVAALRFHKDQEPDHYYCKKCDLDCSDWVDLTQHKVNLMAPFLEGKMKDSGQFPQHIVCEFCGEEFKSFGGRQKHRETMHRAEQNIVCPGCDMIFLRASKMLDHLETNQCTMISSYDFRRAVQKKYITTKILEDPGVIDNMRRLGAPSTTQASTTASITSGASEDGDSEDEDGGVSLADGPVHATNQMTMLASLTADVDGLSVGSDSVRSAATLFRGHKEESRKTEAVKMPVEASGSAWKSKSTSRDLFPTAKPTPATSMALAVVDTTHTAVTTTGDMLERNICDVGSRDWDPENFHDPVIDRYLCPFPGCKEQSFADFKGIEQHFIFGHTKCDFPCPACLKVFPKPSWLIGHVESSTKCRIQKASQFQQLVNDISGGFLRVKPVIQPPVYRPSTAVVKAGQIVDGIMTAEFKAVLPTHSREPRW